ncbi:MAG TPA: hypothetical protein VM925_16570 [Labilithrix sp.]|nr:hypothetical protein [Labilithrix sp.]
MRGTSGSAQSNARSSWSGNFAPRGVTGREGSIGIGSLRVFVGKKVQMNYHDGRDHSSASSRSWGIAHVPKAKADGSISARGLVTTTWKAQSTDGHATANGRTTLQGSQYTHTVKNAASSPSLSKWSSGSAAPPSHPTGGKVQTFDGKPRAQTWSSGGTKTTVATRTTGVAHMSSSGVATHGNVTSTSVARTSSPNAPSSVLHGRATWNGGEIRSTAIVRDRNGVTRIDSTAKPGETPRVTSTQLQ